MTLRTLHLINGLGTGGAERSLAELLPDLRQYDIEPQVAVFHRRAEGVEERVRASGVPVHHVAVTRTLTRAAAVRRLIRECQIDLVHTSVFEADIVGRVAAATTGARSVSTLVSTAYDEVRLQDPQIRRSRLRLVQLADALTAQFCDHFHAVTEDVARSASVHLRVPRRKITVVYRSRRRERLGYPDEERRRRTRERLGLSPDELVLLHVGRQEFAKGHDVLLSAFEAVAASRTDVVLLLAGRNGSSSPIIRPLLDRMPAGTVRELGHREDVPDLLAASDVFVFPSRYEGIGGAALEAMALGTPIVASALAGLQETCGDVPVWVPPDDPDALTTAIEEVLDDLPRTRRRALSGITRFDDMFDHDSVVEQMATLFHRVVRSRPETPVQEA